MRVIAGNLRGRKLMAPPGETTRPILDRVKVALFDWLGSRLARPGVLPAINVLDIFCGGGSMGIECLSRGAASCTFIDSHSAAIGCLQHNLAGLELLDRARVLTGPAEVIRIPAPPQDGYGLVFLDPPYLLSESVTADSVLGRVFIRLRKEIPMSQDATIVWRYSAEQLLPEEVPGGWRVVESRSWGTLAITLLKRLESAA